MQLLYYGEYSDLHLIEDQAMESFNNVLKHSKIEHRITCALHMLEIIVEYNVGHPKIIDALQNQILFKTVHDSMYMITKVVTAGRKSDYFSDKFYDILFQYALNMLPNRSSSQAVELIKVFENKRAYIEEFTRK